MNSIKPQISSVPPFCLFFFNVVFNSNDKKVSDVTTFNHNNDVPPEFRTKGIEPISPLIANQLTSHRIRVCYIVLVRFAWKIL